MSIETSRGGRERRVHELRVRDDLLLSVNGSAPEIPDEEWARLLTASEETMEAHARRCRVLVYSLGAGPNPAQRSLALDRGWRNNTSPIAVVLDKVLVRGVITAFSWFGMNIAAFDTKSLAKAYAHLGLSPTEIDWVERELPAMLAAVR